MELGPLLLLGLRLLGQQLVDPVPPLPAPAHHHVLPLQLRLEAKERRDLPGHVVAQLVGVARHLGRLRLDVGPRPTGPGLLELGSVRLRDEFLAQVEEEVVVDSAILLQRVVARVFGELADLRGRLEAEGIVAGLASLVDQGRGFLGEGRELVDVGRDDGRRRRRGGVRVGEADRARRSVGRRRFVGDLADVVGDFLGLELLDLWVGCEEIALDGVLFFFFGPGYSI